MLKKILLASCLSCFVTTGFAGVCAEGNVDRVIIGGWGGDDLVIKFKNVVPSSRQHPSTFFVNETDLVRINPASSDRRIKALTATALAAAVSGKRLYAFSSTNNCASATEITLIN